MIEKPTRQEQEDLIDLRASPAFKLFRLKIVQPYEEQLGNALLNLNRITESEGPVLAAQLRLLRKIFDDLNDAIDVK